MINIQFEFYPNKNCCAIHTSRELPDAGGSLNNPPTKEIKPLFDALKAIEGVVDVSFRKRYEIIITKGTVFQWENINRKTTTELIKFFSQLDNQPKLQSRNYFGRN